MYGIETHRGLTIEEHKKGEHDYGKDSSSVHEGIYGRTGR